MMFCSGLRRRFRSRLRDYDLLQFLAVILIYIQIGCALIGSLGALYNGVLLINLAIALFALVAIESSSQSLGRTYAFLLFCSLFIDASWFFLFAKHIWNLSSKEYGASYSNSVKLVLWMEIVGCSVRLISSLMWFQIYRLGAESTDHSGIADFEVRNSFLSSTSTTAVPRECPDPGDVLGGSYDPPTWFSPFADGQEYRSLNKDQNSSFCSNHGSNSGTEATKKDICSQIASV